MAMQKMEQDHRLSTAESLIVGCPVIETKRLLLRPPHQDDIDDMVSLANNLSVASMLGSMP